MSSEAESFSPAPNGKFCVHKADASQSRGTWCVLFLASANTCEAERTIGMSVKDPSILKLYKLQ
jgi:hypothetical protein